MHAPSVWSAEERRRAALADFTHAFSHDDLDVSPPPQAHVHMGPMRGAGSGGGGGGASSSPDPSLYLSPAGAIANLSRHGRVTGPADLAPDGGARRHLVHVPRALAFSGSGGAEFNFPRRVAEEGADLDEDDEAGEDDEYDDAESGVGAGSFGEGQALLGLGQARPAPSSGGGLSGPGAATALSEWKLNVDAEGRARRARLGGGGVGGVGRAASATSKTPLLAQRSPLEGSVRSPLSMPLLGANESFQHFTPQSRRKLIRRRLGASQVAQLRAQRSWWSWMCCGRENPFTTRRVTLVALLLLITLTHSSELVLRKVVASGLYNYRWFLFESVALLTFLVSSLVALCRASTVRHFLSHHGVPYKFLFLSSLLDCTHALALVLAVGVLPPVWGVVLPQLLIPFALLFRFFVTDGERVGRWGLLGSVLLVGGVLTLVLPHLLSFEPCNRRSVSGVKFSHSELRTELLVNVLIVVVGTVPAAASAIYKQSYLQHHSMDSYFMNAALSGLQAVWGILLSPLALDLQYAGNSGVQQHGRVRTQIGETAPSGPSGSGSDDGTDGGSGSDISSSNEASSVPLPSPTHSASSEALTWTDDVSRNMFVNFRQGAECLAGINSEPGDTCEQLFPLPVIQLSLLIVSMASLQLLLQYLMSRSSRENLLASALSGGVLLAVLLFQVPQLHDWLPSWELGDCLPPYDPYIIVGMTVLMIGAIIAQWEPSQQPMDLDVWARMEEIAHREEIDAARRAAKRNRR